MTLRYLLTVLKKKITTVSRRYLIRHTRAADIREMVLIEARFRDVPTECGFLAGG